MRSEPGRQSGRFWLAGAPDEHVGGWLDLSGRWPAVDLAEPLTPSMRPLHSDGQTEGGNTSWVSADDDVEPATTTIYGLVRKGSRRRVTLVEAFNVGREQVMGLSMLDRGSERLQASYALIGAHVEEAALFRQARLRLRYLDTWAHLPGLEMEFTEDGSHIALKLERQEQESVETREPPGRLILDSSALLPQLTLRGAAIKRNAVLRWESNGAGLTIEELWAKLVNPLRTLQTLALDADSPAVSLDVRIDREQDWLQVLHPGVEDDDQEQPRQILLTRRQLDLAALEQWLFTAATLRPVPQLVAGVALSPSERTLENQLLELAAAAEGLHRRLYPNARLMTPGRARRVRHAASAAVPEDVSALVNEALAHLEEPTYRSRLRTVIELSDAVLPGITGNFDAWIARVGPARNGFAHQLPRASQVEIEEHLVLMRSLRWMLTTVLLREAGVDADALAERLGQHQPYLHFRRQAKRWLPEVYGD